MSQMQRDALAIYNARRLSKDHLAAWGATGEAQQKELKVILSAVMRTVRVGTSPSKAIKETIKKLEGFFARNEVRGDLRLINQRHIHFRLAFPVNKEDKLIFRLLDGTINARTGATKLENKSPVILTFHALQRLFERLDQPDEKEVLDEIYSSLRYASHWHAGGVEASAKCWPLVSKNGFFVATTAAEQNCTTIVTWIMQAGSGKKWGLPLGALAALIEKNPNKLESAEFAREFIRSFPWMRYEHAPADDYFTKAEMQRDAELALSDDQGKEIGEGQLPDPNWVASTNTKLSASYIPGLNYENTFPPFGFRTEHRGVVVHTDAEGITVGLNNGWIGKIPKKSLMRGHELIAGFTAPGVGEDVTVVIHKIKYFASEGAYSVSLDTKDVSAADWAAIEKSNPIGFITKATILEKFKDEFVLKTHTGLRGSIFASDVQNYLQIIDHRGTVFGMDIDVQVSGFKPEKKCLVFSLQPELAQADATKSYELSIGDRICGICIDRKPHFARIELMYGQIGVLLLFNHWGRALPLVDEKIEVRVVHKDETKFNFLVASDPPSALDRVFPPVIGTQEIWDQFMDQHRSGDILEVQVLFWMEDRQCFVVNTGSGVCGMMSVAELGWAGKDRTLQKESVKPGDVFKAVIKKIDPTKRKLTFSKKRYDSQLSPDKLPFLKVGDLHDGIVVEKQDYGYFVWLPSTNVEGLLHKSKMSEDELFAVGDPVQVRIENIDILSKRLSLASPSLMHE